MSCVTVREAIDAKKRDATTENCDHFEVGQPRYYETHPHLHIAVRIEGGKNKKAQNCSHFKQQRHSTKMAAGRLQVMQTAATLSGSLRYLVSISPDESPTAGALCNKLFTGALSAYQMEQRSKQEICEGSRNERNNIRLSAGFGEVHVLCSELTGLWTDAAYPSIFRLARFSPTWRSVHVMQVENKWLAPDSEL